METSLHYRLPHLTRSPARRLRELNPSRLHPPSRLRCRHRPVRRSTLKHSRPACRSTSARASPIQPTSGPSRRPRQRSRRDPDSHLASITRGRHGRRSMAAPRSVRPRHESLPRHLPRFLGCCSPQSRTPAAVLLPTPSSSSASPLSEVSRRREVAPSQRSRRRFGFLTRLRTSSTASTFMQEENATYVSWTTPTKFLVADCVRNDCVAKAALGRDAAAGTVEVVETEAD